MMEEPGRKATYTREELRTLKSRIEAEKKRRTFTRSTQFIKSEVVNKAAVGETTYILDLTNRNSEVETICSNIDEFIEALREILVDVDIEHRVRVLDPGIVDSFGKILRKEVKEDLLVISWA